MATATAPLSAERRERLFFLAMAIAIALAAIGGFGSNILRGFTSFATEPWWVHLHGITMMSWLGLYIGQNWLAWRGEMTLHRRLGRIAGGWSVWMVIDGIASTAATVHLHRNNPAFPSEVFLIGDWLNILAFGAFTWAGIWLRRRTDWHRRLMLSGTIIVLLPGAGRLMPPAMGPMAVAGVIGLLLGFFAAAMIFDRAVRGKIHPAYYWGLATLAALIVCAQAIAGLPPFTSLVGALQT
jgi:hypothetical protein